MNTARAQHQHSTAPYHTRTSAPPRRAAPSATSAACIAQWRDAHLTRVALPHLPRKPIGADGWWKNDRKICNSLFVQHIPRPSRQPDASGGFINLASDTLPRY
eukprot:6198744-Pleurochrysis_carterae.AAC.2